jgi:integrase
MVSNQKTRSIVLFENYVHSPKTRELYSTLINMFLKFHDIQYWDYLLTTDKPQLKENIEDYLIYVKNQNKSQSHLRNITFSIQSFLESHDYDGINWKKIRRLLGKTQKSKNSRPYTTEEIKQMLSVAKSLRNRALILFFSSSGVRRGAIPGMKIKDLRQMPHGCLAVTVYPNEPEEYVTFINKEALRSFNCIS